MRVKHGRFLIQCNATNATRRTLDGRDYLVVPAVAIKAGVLNGELVTADEIGRHFGKWNGIPFVLNHPKDADGVEISANDPAVLEEYGLGRFFSADFRNDGLHGEIWLEIAKARKLGGQAAEVLRRLEGGKPLELSTSYFCDIESGAGEFNGVPYSGIQRNIAPDHLAALPGSVGACSWADGCGAPRTNKDGKMKTNILSGARRPTYDGIEETSWADVSKTFEAYRDGYYSYTDAERPDDPVTRVEDAPAQMKQWIAARSLLGDPDADDWRNLLFFPVVNPGTNNLNAGAVRAVLGGRAAQADIPRATLESAQDEARRLLELEFPREDQRANSSSIKKLLTGLARALGFNIQEEDFIMNREEMISFILQSGFDISEEALTETPDATLAALVAHLQEMASMADDAAPAGQSDGDSTELAANQQAPAQDCGAQLPPAVADLVKLVDDLGGSAIVRGLLTNAQQAASSKRASLIAELVNNDNCLLTKQQLEAMPDDALSAVYNSFEPADYGGRIFGAPTATNADEIEPLVMPDIFQKREG